MKPKQLPKIPAPPPKRRVPPPPPAKKAADRVSVGSAGEYVKPASGHVNRVTLNLLRHSTVCPEDLRGTLDKLADKHEWKMIKLNRVERELIFATVTKKLADQAVSEFDARMDTIIDHRHNYVHCRLCGHEPIRFEFTLVNTKGGKDVQTGSVCIHGYGVSVDGEAVAERAFLLIQQAIAKAERKAEMEDWQAAHADHADDFEYLKAKVLPTFKMYRNPWTLYDYLQPNWKGRVRKGIANCKGAINYYEKWGYLSETRTEQVYGKDGLLSGAMVNEINAAIRERREVIEKWQGFLLKVKSRATDTEIRVLEEVIRKGRRYRNLTDFERTVIDRLRGGK